MKQLHDTEQAQALALAIVDTLPEPFLVLDDTLHLLAASRCFYDVFCEDPVAVHGVSLFELSGGAWDIPGLRQLLAAVVDDRTTIDGFEFERDFAKLGRRTLCLKALPIRDEGGSGRMVLVAIKDITERRVAEQEKQRLLEHTEELLEQQRTLLREMRHRIANSLQIIASILLLKAGAVASEETKNELRAAHQGSCQWPRYRATCMPLMVSRRLRSALTSQNSVPALQRPWWTRCSSSTSLLVLTLACSLRATQ